MVFDVLHHRVYDLQVAFDFFQAAWRASWEDAAAAASGQASLFPSQPTPPTSQTSTNPPQQTQDLSWLTQNLSWSPYCELGQSPPSISRKFLTWSFYCGELYNNSLNIQDDSTAFKQYDSCVCYIERKRWVLSKDRGTFWQRTSLINKHFSWGKI